MTTKVTESPLAHSRYVSCDKFRFNPHLIRLVAMWASPENRSAKLGTSRNSHSMQDSHGAQTASSLSRPLTASAACIAQVIEALLLTSVICLSFATLQGQKVTGTVSGTVVDSSGAVVPGANIVVTNTNTGVVIFNTATDQTGTYNVPAVQPGTYSIAVSHSGFKTDLRSGVVIQVNQNGVVDFTLQVGETSQQVEVTAAAALLVTQSAALSNVVGEKAVASLPLNGRFFTELVTLTPGVAPASTGAGVTQNPNGNTFLGARSGWPGAETNGQRPGSNNYTINGIDNEKARLRVSFFILRLTRFKNLEYKPPTRTRNSGKTQEPRSTSPRRAGEMHSMAKSTSSSGTAHLMPQTTSIFPVKSRRSS